MSKNELTYINICKAPDEYESFPIDVNKDYKICLEFWSYVTDPHSRFYSSRSELKYINSKTLVKFLIENSEFETKSNE